MTSSSRLLLALILLLSWAAPALAQDDTPTPVPASQLDGRALKLAIGTVDPPGPGWSWYSSAGAYVAIPEDGEGVVAVVYVPASSSANIGEVKSMVRREMLAGSEAEKKKTAVQIKEIADPAFGTAFEFEYTDVDGAHAGSMTTAKGHTLFILGTGPNAKELLRRGAAGFHPTSEVRSAEAVSSQSFLEKTEAVPASKLNGQVLRVPGGYITAPGGWSWRQVQEGGHVIYIAHDGDARFIVLANENRVADLHKFVEGFSEGFTSQSGGKLEKDIDYTPADLPFPGSEKVSLAYSVDGELMISGTGYLGSNGKQTLALFSVGLEPAEAELLSMLKGYTVDPERSKAPSASFAGLILGLLILAAGGVVNMVAKRPMFDAAKLAMVLNTLLMITAMVAAVSKGSYELGYAMGGFILPLALFAYLSSKFSKKKEAWAAAQPPSLPPKL